MSNAGAAARREVVRDIASLPRDTDHDCWQLRPGPLRIDVALVALPASGIHYERVDGLVRSRGVSPTDYLSLGVPLNGTHAMRCNGADTDGRVVALGSNREMDCVVDRGGAVTVVLGATGISRLFLNEEGGAELRARWRSAGFDPVSARPDLARRLGTLALDLLAHASPRAAASVAEDALLSVVERILLDATPAAPRPRRGRPSERRHLALAAESVIHARKGPLSVRDVCAATGASERSLETAFRDQFGVAPIQYIRMVRLARVRRDLLAAGPGTTVTEVAYRQGFWHLSRFAGHYRAMFLESPSATLGKGWGAGRGRPAGARRGTPAREARGS